VAGLGKRTFQQFDILTAADTNGYLMEQSVMRFASSVERDAAIPSPTEGMTCYLDSVNWTMQYNGSSWVFIAGERPYFSGSTSSQTIAATDVIVNNTQTVSTNRGGFTITGTGGVIRVPATGLYQINGTVEFGANATGYRSAYIDAETTSIFGQRVPAVATAGINTKIILSGVVFLSSNQYISTRALQNSGSTISLTGSLVVTYLGA
jgi:hypothetical protein